MAPTTLLTDVQHVNVKLFASGTVPDDLLDVAIAVFHRWIQTAALPELLIDVADYRHVADGPGVILIGHAANYSLDFGGGRPGLLYNQKARWGNTFAERLRLAYERALEAARRLEQEPEFAGRLHFNPRACEVVINDRLLAPNTTDTWAALRPELEAFFLSTWRTDSVRLHWSSADPRDRFRAEVRS